ncbi:MAM domain-containing protein 2 isoform X3 [Silurus meridionalis]|uniref:MAM domain-containing protein 2 isoform X1 n=1 Tax=Silurus meridionalis TaxID=175797 RepID=UPI001EECD4D2|nr:MAM domain-containing protein 2 isoform X1 [Silurus meridionalis]XP_046717742.1 MAM domain-containing protein 2 isoform X3 [Silurus meridionalis]
MFLFVFLSVLAITRGTRLPGSCSFQKTMCDYTPDSAFLTWNLNPNDHFITVDVTSQGEGDKAFLLGPYVELQDWSCFRLVYQITVSGSLRVLSRSDGESFDRTLWSASSPSESWIVTTIDLQNSTEPYKIVIEGGRGSAEGSSVSIFEIDISDKYCIECDFEESHLCGYVNQWSGNVNWYVGRGAPSKPTLGDGPGHYMYVDSIHSRTLKEVATLVSPITSAPMWGCLSFQYQQDHAEGHMFSVYSRDRAGQYSELWRADQPESNQLEQETQTHVWIPVQVPLSAPYPLQVVFEVSFNSPKGGRVLLDDVAFSTESCSAETEPVFDPSVADCDFELGFCGYTQKLMDNDMWKRVSVRPNMYREGDHTTGRGSFLMASSRFIMQSGSISRLFGPALPGKQKFCLRFFYSLRGFIKSENTLVVYLHNSSTMRQSTKRVWSSSETTRDVWIQVELNIQTQNITQVMFASLCKSFWNCGTAALDDISLRLGDCELPQGSPLLVPSHCDFEKGLCGFSQEKERDTSNWVLIRGPTPTSYTGPKRDHTTGVGHYLYIEASLMLPGHNALLVSHPLRGSRAAQCLLFFYHMYGSGTGSLRVLLRSDLEEGDTVLWERRGEQGISWMKASVTYQYHHQHQIVFEATKGTSILSDTAIDDITFQKGPCKDMKFFGKHL